VKLQSSTEAPNLHVTAAHGCRTPKRSIPHAIAATPLPPKRLLCHCPHEEGTSNVRRSCRRSDPIDVRRRTPCRRSDPLKPASRTGRRSDLRATAPPPVCRSRRGSMKRAKFDDEALTTPKGDQLPRSLAAETARSRREPA
jgi:hypothetical protein